MNLLQLSSQGAARVGKARINVNLRVQVSGRVVHETIGSNGPECGAQIGRIDLYIVAGSRVARVGCHLVRPLANDHECDGGDGLG